MLKIWTMVSILEGRHGLGCLRLFVAAGQPGRARQQAASCKVGRVLLRTLLMELRATEKGAAEGGEC